MGLFSKLFKGVKKIFKGIKKVVKKVWKSPLGKIALIAAAVWTGGAAMAAMGTGGGFGGFTSALMGGVSTGAGGSIGAMGALKGAVGLGAAGGKFGLAGVKAAAGASSALPGAAVAAGLPSTIAPVSSYVGAGGAALPASSVLSTGAGAATAAIPTAVKGAGLIGKAMSVPGKVLTWAQNNPLLAATAAQSIGGALQYKAQVDREDDRIAQEREWAGGQSLMDSPWFDPKTGMLSYISQAELQRKRAAGQA